MLWCTLVHVFSVGGDTQDDPVGACNVYVYGLSVYVCPNRVIV